MPNPPSGREQEREEGGTTTAPLASSWRARKRAPTICCGLPPWLPGARLRHQLGQGPESSG
eukprot:5969200-Pyramimonas_sp.AAC.1